MVWFEANAVRYLEYLHGEENDIRSKKLGRGIFCEANEGREWWRQDDPDMQGPESNNLHSKWQKSHLSTAQEPLQPLHAPMENTSTMSSNLLDL
jgi:hypothetical protein